MRRRRRTMHRASNLVSKSAAKYPVDPQDFLIDLHKRPRSRHTRGGQLQHLLLIIDPRRQPRSRLPIQLIEVKSERTFLSQRLQECEESL